MTKKPAFFISQLVLSSALVLSVATSAQAQLEPQAIEPTIAQSTGLTLTDDTLLLDPAIGSEAATSLLPQVEDPNLVLNTQLSQLQTENDQLQSEITNLNRQKTALQNSLDEASFIQIEWYQEPTFILGLGVAAAIFLVISVILLFQVSNLKKQLNFNQPTSSGGGPQPAPASAQPQEMPLPGVNSPTEVTTPLSSIPSQAPTPNPTPTMAPDPLLKPEPDLNQLSQETAPLNQHQPLPPSPQPSEQPPISSEPQSGVELPTNPPVPQDGDQPAPLSDDQALPPLG